MLHKYIESARESRGSVVIKKAILIFNIYSGRFRARAHCSYCLDANVERAGREGVEVGIDDGQRPEVGQRPADHPAGEVQHAHGGLLARHVVR